MLLLLVNAISIETVVSTLSAFCLPHLTTLYIITGDDSIPEPSAFSPLFYYNCFPSLNQISIMRLKEEHQDKLHGNDSVIASNNDIVNQDVQPFTGDEIVSDSVNQNIQPETKDQETVDDVDNQDVQPVTDNEDALNTVNQDVQPFTGDENVSDGVNQNIQPETEDQETIDDADNRELPFTGDESVSDNTNKNVQPATKDHESITDVDNQQEVVHERKEDETSEVRDPIDQSINTHYDNSQPVETQNDGTSCTQEEMNEYEEQRVICDGDRENDLHTDYQSNQSETIDQEGYVEVNDQVYSVDENKGIAERIPDSSGIVYCFRYMNS